MTSRANSSMAIPTLNEDDRSLLLGTVFTFFLCPRSLHLWTEFLMVGSQVEDELFAFPSHNFYRVRCMSECLPLNAIDLALLATWR